MTIIAVKPHVFHNYLIRIDADEYQAAVSSFKLTPNTPISTWKGGTPTAVFSDVGAPVWAAALKLAQDWETPASLALYLLNNAGQTKKCVFSPKGTGPSFSVSLILASPEIGGDVDQWGETTVAMGVTGQPVFGLTVPPFVAS